MKSLGGFIAAVFLGFGVLAMSSTAQAYCNVKGHALLNSGSTVHRHKVNINYRRRFGRRYGRRISSFVRSGSYATRSSLRQRHVKKRRSWW
ncbi:MAG: hypothetical protein L3J67_09005 [Hyphomicrobiaceae bacterium]|nr:hypothetical protein [Hyphomicrobiaceae bacterium]